MAQCVMALSLSLSGAYQQFLHNMAKPLFWFIGFISFIRVMKGCNYFIVSIASAAPEPPPLPLPLVSTARRSTAGLPEWTYSQG